MSDTKLHLFSESVIHCTDFLIHNHLPVPEYKLVDDFIEDDLYYACGCYKDKTKTVYVCLKKTGSLGKAGRQWSWPGYKIDRTPYGVVAHEVGHHVDFTFIRSKQFNKEQRNEATRVFTIKKEKVSGYEPVPHEAFAESMRIFITNPDLLMLCCPNRYDYIVNVLKLKPNIDKNWKQVLIDNNAPARTINAANNWIKKNERITVSKKS